MIIELLEKTRSYRRFDESVSITDEQMRTIASALRLCPSAANLQRVRVKIVNNDLQNQTVFDTLAFAAYLKDWHGPEQGERPTAYAVLASVSTPDVNLAIDIGIAAEAMLLAAREMGIGGCIFRSFDPKRIAEVIGNAEVTPVIVIAFGHPAEQVVIDEAKDGDIRYYRDAKDVHHVPKLSLDELLL